MTRSISEVCAILADSDRDVTLDRACDEGYTLASAAEDAYEALGERPDLSYLAEGILDVVETYLPPNRVAYDELQELLAQMNIAEDGIREAYRALSDLDTTRARDAFRAAYGEA